MMHLVTGAAGSIGSALVRALIEHGEEVRAFDIAESGLHELSESVGSPRLRTMIGDVRDRERLRRALDGVDIAIHAAALKHVPACEYDPGEAVRTNVLGTEHAILAAHDAGVQRFVLISTDKAAEPCGVMGATKLLAERVLVGLARWVHTSLVAVRFGNVFGSRGSIVPTVLGRAGKPIRVTDPLCTRYTMRMREAVEFVLAVAGSRHEGCTVARGMAAYVLGDLIGAFDGYPSRTEVTGLRPGERLHETLIGANELRVLQDGWYILGTGAAGERVTSEHALKLSVEELARMIQEVAE